MFDADRTSGSDPLMGPVDLDWARNCLRGMSSQSFFKRYHNPALILSLQDGVKTLEDSATLNATLRSSRTGPTKQIGIALIKQRRRASHGRSRRITLGRSGDTDIAVKIATVSKLHLFFEQLESDWVVTDNFSTNGSLLENQRLAGGERYPLKSGDSLMIGPDLVGLFLMPKDMIHYLLT